MPAEQEALDRARVITRVRLNGTPTDLTLLAEAVLSLEAELLAAQEREADSALRERGALEERDAWRQTAREAADQRDAAQEREKALRVELESERTLREVAERERDKAQDRLAGSPSEKPGSALLESAQGLSEPGMADAD